ncbi:transcriptional regulator [Bordetella genomosp. 1]|uniref:Transcriptional regulator n=1 Tax=Bordetella genomosp. 1 TaxID=1395607 RepID=A0A261RVU7_9BORD|nr:response regulator transcription factor [Bordetella genomosp. 1]OZI29011.1 transcriptional regulator [Bordetella genomosp. 1]
MQDPSDDFAPLVLHLPCGVPAAATLSLEDNLRRSGWRVRGHAERVLSPEAVRAIAPDMLLLSGDARQGDALILQLRRLCEIPLSAACIVLLNGATPFLRIQMLRAGADICCALDESPEWMAAELIAMFERRRATSPAGPPRRWRLCSSSRYLFGPQGERLPLTPGEGLFIGRLLAAPNQRLPRVGGPGGSRGDDVTVARLRGKARLHGIDLPVCAVRRWGYLFIDEA